MYSCFIECKTAKRIPIIFDIITCSGRAPSGIQNASSASTTVPKKSRSTEEEEDLTQGMEDPPTEPRIVEVVATPTNPPITGQSNATTGNSTLTSTGSKKQDNELQPLKSGNMADLDEPIEGTYYIYISNMITETYDSVREYSSNFKI